jgi:hypothetical protein
MPSKLYKKGQSGNPNGRPPMSADLRMMGRVTKYEFERLIHRYLIMTRDELEAATKDPKTPILELTVASILKKAIIGGDQTRLNFILDRLIGKVADSFESKNLNLNINHTLADDELIEKAERVLEEVRKRREQQG